MTTGDSSVYTDEIARAIDQICSPVYAQMFEKVAKEQPSYFTHEQHTLLAYYPNEITWYQGEQRHEIIERIRHTHLKWFMKWLREHNNKHTLYREWNSVMDDLMLHTTNLFFRIDLGDVITSDETRRAFHQVADTIKDIFSSIIQSNPDTINPTAIPLIQIFLLILFYFTWDDDLIIHLKTLQLVPLITELIRTSNNDNDIHLQAYRILAVIMTEADLKQLQSSDRITAVFINFIKDVIDGGISYEARLHNSLRSLKALTQHDEIREELIKQGGHSLFLRCVLEEHFNPIKAKLPTLEILLALAFNKDFATTLKDNTTFMDHLQTLTSSPHEDLQRVATAMIWQLEKTQDHESPPTSLLEVTKKQYDIMISYSHSDKELCDRILNVLEKDQLHVWIDSRLMHGTTFDVMAEAIENSEFVVVCMSDAYKQSPFCEMEASYAVKRRCRIIPLIMTPNYKADGWLGVLTSTSISIDFPKLGFDEACQELKKQIELFRINDPSSTANIAPEPEPSMVNNEEPHPTVKYPHCIDKWTEEHVKSFLLDKNLDAFLPVLEGMNGQSLHQVYLMCQANQQGMFLSLKDDVAKSEQGTLSLKDYLTFLKEIKVYIPYTPVNHLDSTSAVCNLM